MKILPAILIGALRRSGRLIGKIQAELILFLFYFLIFTPYSYVLRLFGHDPLRLKRQVSSNWQDIDLGRFDQERMKRQS
jgi:hypothetical protein